ncbi:hypothetical protein DCAR_0519921 [Daucus carota subsp. sativus]|uniref:GRF-type domain-containing protein n=1 Tax=Daucus carota subsp. sativus TaxID=79200 RepID=A0A164Y958_DAUCS|nr:hypothetical protein DCAR_0519921 [Daucus carota subsp. sativus]
MSLYESSSSSRKTSSSIRNSYVSDVKSGNSEHPFIGVKCKCDLPAPCQVAWKEGTLNPGRRFFGCSRYKDPNKKCDFFLWADPSFPDRARDVIKELKMKLKRKDDELCNAKLEMNFVERKMLVPNEEVTALRKKLEETSEVLKNREKEGCNWSSALFFSFVVVCILLGLVKFD